jgi:two-component system nitrogen regulation response regulator GlnG
MLVLVDDNDLFRSALAANLRDDGYQVLEFSSGTSVPVDQLNGVDALLSELAMAGESGLHLARRFHAHHPSVPVVILTRAASVLSDQVAHLGYVTVLPKPLDYDALASFLQRASV